MSETTDNYESIEARLSAYGTVLQGHLDGEQDGGATGTLLVGGFGAQNERPTVRRKPAMAVLSAAAAILLTVGLLVPSLVGSDPVEPITVNGGDVASAPPTGDDAETDDHETGDDAASDHDDEKVGEDEQADDQAIDDQAHNDKEADGRDWTSFSVAVGGLQDDADEATQDGTHSEDGNTLGTAAASADHDENDSDNESDAGKPEDPESDDGRPTSNDCPDGKELRAEGCVVVGTPPTTSPGGCPADAVVVGEQCYEIVPPSCGELQTAPDGSGCLKLIGAASEQGGCPANYERDGSTCVKLLDAPLSCSQGTPSGDSCVIKETPTGGDSGCAQGQTQFGDGCYELSSPTANCGELASLSDGSCRLPVDGEHSTECPAGLQPWDNICYRYEDPPTYDCAGGESDGAGWCLMTEAGTPGPEVCDDGVLQDEQGCYVLVDVNGEGNCGELPELGGMCRKAKESYQTWSCSDGETVYEPTCKVWAEAVAVTCLAGEPVENNTRCKTIEDPISTAGCPSNALQDGQGCYTSKEPQLSCGELPKTPDGQQCKTWVSAADSGGDCADGFELVGGYCKKYVDAVAGTCSGAEPVIVSGAQKCKYTTSPSESNTGCPAGAIEQSGDCYSVVPATCADLDLDLYGQGCKKPIEAEPSLICEAGFVLVGDDCINKG